MAEHEQPPVPFQPGWRYNKAGDSRLVMSPEEEQALGSDWKDSPAAFGVETHPTQSGVQVSQPAPVAGSSLPAPPDWERRLAAVEQQVHGLDRDLRAMGSQVHALQAAQTHETEPERPARPGRKD